MCLAWIARKPAKGTLQTKQQTRVKTLNKLQEQLGKDRTKQIDPPFDSIGRCAIRLLAVPKKETETAG
jgi:hypothetical protein